MLPRALSPLDLFASLQRVSAYWCCCICKCRKLTFGFIRYTLGALNVVGSCRMIITITVRSECQVIAELGMCILVHLKALMLYSQYFSLTWKWFCVYCNKSFISASYYISGMRAGDLTSRTEMASY